jgi:hypothetical protein
MTDQGNGATDRNSNNAEELMNRFFDFGLTEQETRELEDLILSDPRVMRLFVQSVQDTSTLASLALVPFDRSTLSSIEEESSIAKESQLARTSALEGRTNQPNHAAPLGSPLSEKATTGRQRIRQWELMQWWWQQRMVVAASIGVMVLATVVGMLATRDSGDRRSAIVLGASYQAALRCDSGGGRSLHAQDRLSPGERLHVDRGTAELLFGDGTRVVVTAPSRLRVIDTNRCYLQNGSLVARVAHKSGFTVGTPLLKVEDLGTEFGVSVADDKSTDVAVFEGAVRLVVDLPSNESLGLLNKELTARQAIRVHQGADGKSLAATIPFDMVAFERTLDRVITGVKANSGRHYAVLPGGMRENARAFTDRIYEWNGVSEAGMPPFLVGADYVCTANDDKQNPSLEVDVQIARPCDLYLVLNKDDTIPDWLRREFELTPHEIGLDRNNRQLGTRPGVTIDATFSIWRRRIASANTVTLGAKDSSTEFGNFGIVAVPLEE